ncbi:MAG: aminotransferase class V-fold PLP-dependent enzyme [Emergencia sp.]
MIYLDNGATSFPKPNVMLAEMESCMRRWCGNPGRSGHDMSMKTGEMIYRARKSAASLFNIRDPGRLVFTKNTTESLNLAMMGILEKGDHVITTSMEHNSVLRPLNRLASRGVSHTVVPADSQGRIRAEEIEKAVTADTRLIVMTGASNVTGTVMPVEEVGRLAEKKGILFLVDGAQTAGCMPVDVERQKISMLAFPGHKGLLGPLGTGGLYAAPHIPLKPLLCGGTGTESRNRRQPEDFPEGFEAGTVNAPGIIGLGRSVELLKEAGIDRIEKYERTLIRQFDEAVSEMNFVDLYGPVPEEKTGISLFNIRNMDCEEVAARLNREFSIAVRAGYHCAPLAHQTVGTWDTGAVRISVGPFNTAEEMRKTAEAIWKIGKR